MKNNLFKNTKSFIEQNSSIEEAVEKFKKEAEDTLVVLDNNFSTKQKFTTFQKRKNIKTYFNKKINNHHVSAK